MASLALFSWPLVVFALFATLPQRSALIWSLLAAYLFLPVGFGINLPGLPPLEKNSIPVLVIIAVLILQSRRRSAQQSSGLSEMVELENYNRFFGWLFYGFAAVMLLNMWLTIAGNRNTIRFGETVLPGLRPWDFVSMASDTLFMMAPFFLGRIYLARPEDHRLLLKCLALSGLVYSLGVLIEIRFSPQLHNWVYGYHQHSFIQHIRDGYRPKVFLRHGLSVGFFLFTVVFATIALARSQRVERRWKWALAGIWLFLMLAISRNLGALAICLMFLPLFWLGRRTALMAATVVTLCFLAYPAARQANIVPVDKILTLAARISTDRAQSFDFRLRNEDILLSRAAEKPFSGWGKWGRSRVYNELGEDISVTDGLWIITLGQQGWIGYICFFGLLTLPLLALPWMRRHKEVPIETVALALIMAGNCIYLIPNSTLTPIAWLMAGALAGFVQFDAKTTETVRSLEPGKPTRPAYTRFPAAALGAKQS